VSDERAFFASSALVVVRRVGSAGGSGTMVVCVGNWPACVCARDKIKFGTGKMQWSRDS